MPHGPTAYGGMEIKNIYTLQGLAHVKAFTEKGSGDSTTGKLLQNLIKQHTLEVGLSGEMTDSDNDRDLDKKHPEIYVKRQIKNGNG